jgi:hypothetical protein
LIVPTVDHCVGAILRKLHEPLDAEVDAEEIPF